MGPTGVARILQIHPTRQCNLQCLHCYSSSGPAEREELSVDLLRQAITDARSEGYTVVSFSGGEPLVYKPLGDLLLHAQGCDMITTVTTNGMLLDERRLGMLRGGLNLLAISLDGVPESHNRMRASPRAFDTMHSHLEGVRNSGIPFGFIFTLTQHNLDELDWVAAFALEQGAKLLQIHPLESVGRARQMLPNSGPDDIEAAVAYLEAARLQASVGDRLYVQVDLVTRKQIQVNAQRFFADDMPPDPSQFALAELVSPLIIEADGTIVPIRYGFDREFALGNLNDILLAEAAGWWRQERFRSFRELCRQVFEEVTIQSSHQFVNWYEEISSGRRN